MCGVLSEVAVPVSATPILGNMRKITMRADALRALEQRKNSVMQERRRKRMETLGANNEFSKKVPWPRKLISIHKIK